VAGDETGHGGHDADPVWAGDGQDVAAHALMMAHFAGVGPPRDAFLN
jgi:hypothetical protein